MRTLRTFAFVGAWLVTTISVAGAPAGPEAADEILRQNPQIKTLPGVPGNLKGVSVQDCPAGATPDISKNRCVVVSAPASSTAKPWESNYGVAPSFVLILHLNSPKVWGVFRSETPDLANTTMLGEFDVNGRLTSTGTATTGTATGSNQATSPGVASAQSNDWHCMVPDPFACDPPPHIQCRSIHRGSFKANSELEAKNTAVRAWAAPQVIGDVICVQGVPPSWRPGQLLPLIQGKPRTDGGRYQGRP